MRKQIPEPSLPDILWNLRQDILANFNCHRMGIIQGFDEENQTVQVELVDYRVFTTYESPDPFYKKYSLLADVPVYINADNNAGFTCPIVIGQECLVLFNDRDIDKWFTTGTTSAPRTNRLHDLSDGLAIIGFHSQLKKLTNFINSATRMYYGDSEVTLTDKIKIQNSAENLKTIIDDLIDIITALEVVDPISGDLPITATTATSLSDLKTRIATFLTT